jgi:hypothetical protein
MDYEEAVRLCYELRDQWSEWHDLDRGAMVVELRDSGVSQRKLAKWVGCSEGLIRHIEIVGRLPWNWKQLYDRGWSTRAIVASWRAERAEDDAEDEAA